MVYDGIRSIIDLRAPGQRCQFGLRSAVGHEFGRGVLKSGCCYGWKCLRPTRPTFLQMIGDYAVGKTSLIKRYCEGYFTPNYKLTIGVDFAVKDVYVNDTKVTLQLWDVAGHERFGTMTRVYYKYAIAALVVFDVSRPATFEAVLKWRDDVNSKVVLSNDEPIPLILLANKCDLDDCHVNKDDLDNFVQNNGFLAWFETSAMNNTNIDDAMKFTVERILEVATHNRPQMPLDTIVMSPTSKNTRSPSEGEEDSPFKDCCQ